MEQQKSHHGPGIGHFEVVRPRQAHGALHGIAADMQAAHAEFLADVDRIAVFRRAAQAPGFKHVRLMLPLRGFG